MWQLFNDKVNKEMKNIYRHGHSIRRQCYNESLYWNSHVKTCLILMYADDVKLFYTFDNDHGQAVFQLNIDLFVTWCRTNLIDLNLRKCKCMVFSPAHSAFHILPYSRNHSELPMKCLRLPISMHDSSSSSRHRDASFFSDQVPGMCTVGEE